MAKTTTASESTAAIAHPNTVELSDGFKIIAQAPLAKLTTFRLGGQAQWLALPKTPQQLRAALIWGKENSLAVTMLGAGSNLLISDSGLPGLVICTRALRHSEFDPVTGRVIAAAGEPWSSLAWKAARNGLKGFEWTIGIPGTVGGAVVMNAGAHGGETADLLVETEVITTDGQLSILKPEDLAYRYRTSNLQSANLQGANLQSANLQSANLQSASLQSASSQKHNTPEPQLQQRIVTSATFQLRPGYDPPAIKAATAADLQQRRTTQPYHLPNCGSVFRNPPGHSAGKLIQTAGLKGYQIGNAQISTRHANFIVNLGGAKASDVLALICHAQAVVCDRDGVQLETEVKMMGEFGENRT
ncbi:MAG: UDP-N-acetylmuramate dehydrogenase [Phormidesmis sp.]